MTLSLVSGWLPCISHLEAIMTGAKSWISEKPAGLGSKVDARDAARYQR
ncbi:MAG: hypothetical protein ACI92N_002543 [Pseudomonadales bacterium]|jgi:hypothetical protein